MSEIPGYGKIYNLGRPEVRHIPRLFVAGLAEWYKEQLIEEQFGG